MEYLMHVIIHHISYNIRHTANKSLAYLIVRPLTLLAIAGVLPKLLSLALVSRKLLQVLLGIISYSIIRHLSLVFYN